VKGISLKSQSPAARSSGSTVAEELIERQLGRQLRKRRLGGADNQRLLDGIGMQHDRGRLLLFLLDPAIEPTNNRAEHGLHPAVIARRVSQCSKNEKGAGDTIRLGNKVFEGKSDRGDARPLPRPPLDSSPLDSSCRLSKIRIVRTR